jgi:hypothetical protein
MIIFVSDMEQFIELTIVDIVSERKQLFVRN